MCNGHSLRADGHVPPATELAAADRSTLGGTRPMAKEPDCVLWLEVARVMAVKLGLGKQLIRLFVTRSYLPGQQAKELRALILNDLKNARV